MWRWILLLSIVGCGRQAPKQATLSREEIAARVQRRVKEVVPGTEVKQTSPHTLDLHSTSGDITVDQR